MFPQNDSDSAASKNPSPDAAPQNSGQSAAPFSQSNSAGQNSPLDPMMTSSAQPAATNLAFGAAPTDNDAPSAPSQDSVNQPAVPDKTKQSSTAAPAFSAPDQNSQNPAQPTAFVASVQTQTAPQAAFGSAPDGQAKPPKKKSHLPRIIILIVAGLIVIGGVVAAILYLNWYNSDQKVISDAVDNLLKNSSFVISGSETDKSTTLATKIKLAADTSGYELDVSGPIDNNSKQTGEIDLIMTKPGDFYVKMDKNFAASFGSGFKSSFEASSGSDSDALSQLMGLPAGQSINFDMSKYANKWIEIKQDDISDISSEISKLTKIGGGQASNFNADGLNKCFVDLSAKPAQRQQLANVIYQSGVLTRTGKNGGWQYSASTDQTKLKNLLTKLKATDYYNSLAQAKSSCASALGITSTKSTGDKSDSSFQSEVKSSFGFSDDSTKPQSLSLTLNKTRQLSGLTLKTTGSKDEDNATYTFSISTSSAAAVKAPSGATSLSDVVKDATGKSLSDILKSLDTSISQYEAMMQQYEQEYGGSSSDGSSQSSSSQTANL
ncbi:MAG: hypothetical protein LBM73_00515 [Candidatus Nomurabacteria bacterium]|jgi:hypothetical protein|nr:hypothetical protein [Candidatus Nomurabacteria bacterium]